ncbi:MAG: HAD family phosphatase [Verrucomicrobia bacterium]|nr:HAD family phosphatase [Verrucomicrobiota bacterium]
MATEDRIAFPTGDFEGLIFDLDGTLVDSMPAHFAAWCTALATFKAGGVFQEDVFYAMGGRPTHDIVIDLNDQYGLHLDPVAVSAAKREAFLRSLGEIVIYEEVVEYAQSQRGKVPMAVATGGTRIVAEKTLQAVGLSDLFDEVVTSDDVANGKPAPDIYLEAAKRIDVAPERCVAFEDAQPGVLSARAAGMRVVLVPGPVHLV